MIDLWRELQAGDRVRFTHMPTEFDTPGYCLHPDTRAAYQHVVNSGLTYEVYIDHDFPWIDFERITDDGKTEYNSLMINHDGFERVEAT